MVTDLHYRLAHYEWLVGRAGDVDIVGVTGDLADVTNSVPIGVQLVVLEQYLDRLAELAGVLIVWEIKKRDLLTNRGKTRP
jgi:hypothetical protein